MNPFDPSLYLVANRCKHDLEAFFNIVCEAVAGGVTMVQLREKEAAAREMCEIGKKLLSYLKPKGVPLIVNDRVDVAHAIGASGVHLGQSDLGVEEARAILGSRAIIGLSIETIAQALDAEKLAVDYLAASPVFESKTKADCSTPIGLDGLKELCGHSRHPIVGIGGINLSNIEHVFRCGAAGVAVVSAIFDAACPKTAAQEMAKRILR
jgi:thiamine-phosphate pyrophosphorylase